MGVAGWPGLAKRVGWGGGGLLGVPGLVCVALAIYFLIVAHGNIEGIQSITKLSGILFKLIEKVGQVAKSLLVSS